VLHEELGRLPDKYRLPLVLCFLEGQSHADAARRLRWPKGTVAGRIARARDLLRRRLARRGVVLTAAAFGTALTPATGSAVPPALLSATVRSSLAFVSGNTAAVSVPVVRLAEGVFHAMFLSKVKSMALVVCLLGCVALGGLGTLALAQRTGEPGQTLAKGDAPKADAEAVRKLKDRSSANLKEIGLAAHQYLNAHDKWPNNVLGADQKPLLSWRVLLLPYLEQGDLYKEFKLDEPWDSKHNLRLLGKIPEVYRTGTEPKDSAETYYQGFAHKDALFPPGESIGFNDVTDGTANTILVVEAGTAVPWTKPVDLPYAADKPLPKLGGPFKDVIHAVLADGAVFPVKRDFDEKLLRLAITRNDNTVLDMRQLRAEPPAAPNPDRPLPPEADAVVKLRQAAAEAREALQMAQESRREAERLLQQQQQVKEALRDVVARLEKLDRKPASEDVKGLLEEFERTRAELRLLRDKLKRLEPAPAK
jgi:hypothetical protein